MQGAIVNGFVSLVVSTLEKRFNINSAQSGNIGGSYDIGFMLAIIPMTYFGGKRGASKPRYRKPFSWRLFITSTVTIISQKCTKYFWVTYTSFHDIGTSPPDWVSLDWVHSSFLFLIFCQRSYISPSATKILLYSAHNKITVRVLFLFKHLCQITY